MIGTREKLPKTRDAKVHKFSVGGHEGYLTVGLYPDGRVGEIFIEMHKQGSTVAGFVDAVAVAVSIGLQYGVPLEMFVKKYAHTRFEPAGFTDGSEIKRATSVLDYVFRWLAMRYLGEDFGKVIKEAEIPSLSNGELPADETDFSAIIIEAPAGVGGAQ